MVSRAAWWREATGRLTAAGCEDAAFDARCLLEDFAAMNRGHRPDATPLTAAQQVALEKALSRRLAGEPLQYILGEWEFLSLTLQVGKGVLIPRPDTELLCESAAARLQGTPQVLDLCAGSGCVGLGLCSLLPDAQVTAVEFSEAALPYLRANTARYPQYHVTVRQANVLTDAPLFPTGYDAVLSNPPYIPTKDLAGLMREVQHEPRMALDGHADGLDFYRAIAGQWVPLLKNGGLCAVEVGIGQAADVAALFAAAGLDNPEILTDLGGIERVVLGTKK